MSEAEGSGFSLLVALFMYCCTALATLPFAATCFKMEEDPTPVPSVGTRKQLITNEDGVITGEETSLDLGHTESGQVPFGMLLQPEVDVCTLPKFDVIDPSLRFWLRGHSGIECRERHS